MQPLCGEFPSSLDGEGRFIVPMPLRSEFGLPRTDSRLVASLEPEFCISLRSPEDWAKITEEQFRLAQDATERRAAALHSSLSQSVSYDRQGRIRISDDLLARIGIDRHSEPLSRIVIVGQQRQVRIWSRNRWDEELRMLEASYAKSLEDIRNRMVMKPGGAP